MLRQLSSSHVNCQCMVLYSMGMKYAPSVVTSHDNGQSMVIYPSCMKHVPLVVIV